MTNYNGKIQSVRRRYDSLRNFIGRNEVYKAGDILCVSTKNDDDYDLFLDADGVSTFIQLYNRWKNGGGTTPSGQGSNNDGHLNTFDEIVALLEGMPEGSNLKQILDGINTDGLTEEEKQALYDLVNAEEVSEEDLNDMWNEAMQNAEGGGTQEAGAGEDEVSGGGPSLD